MKISDRRFRWVWAVILYPLGMVPAVWLVWQGQAGVLGADPVNVFERSLGLWAFRFLLVCLALGPLQGWFGVNLLQFRRLTGLLAFFYAVLHLLAYVFLDLQGNAAIFWQDLTRRPFIILGMAALLLLLPLALTSNRVSMRWLKARWKRLHRVVYGAALLAGVHFFLSFKTLNRTSAIYLGLLGCVVLLRILLPVRRRFARAGGGRV